MDDASDFEDKIKAMLKELKSVREQQRARLSMDTLIENLDHLTHDDIVKLYNVLVVRLAGYK